MKKVLNNPDMPVGRLIKIKDFLPPPETWEKFVKKSLKKEKGDTHKKTIPIIHIIGLPGAGKTTLTQRLSKTLRVPIFRIGCYRARFSMTPIGEADAWTALFRGLSRRRWKNCIFETTGLNSRESFLRIALPFERMFTIKLEASRKTLARRIQKKKKKDHGCQWLYGTEYRDKYEFVRKLFNCFRKIPADCYIDTDRLTKAAVYKRAIREIRFMSGALTCHEEKVVARGEKQYVKGKGINWRKVKRGTTKSKGSDRNSRN